VWAPVRGVLLLLFGAGRARRAKGKGEYIRCVVVDVTVVGRRPDATPWRSVNVTAFRPTDVFFFHSIYDRDNAVVRIHTQTPYGKDPAVAPMSGMQWSILL